VVPNVAVLIVAGLQVPVIDGVLVELNGSEGAVLFWHNGPIGSNVGATRAVVTIFKVAISVHKFPVGVKV